MKLTAFRIKHFRCLYDTPWIPIHDLTVLIGENDGGKTGTLDALSIFLSANRRPELDDFSFRISLAAAQGNQEHEGEMVLEGQFHLDQGEADQLRELCFFEGTTLVVRRTFSLESTASDGVFLFDTKVHPDPRLQADPDRYTVQQLQELATEFGITLPRSARKADIASIFRQWVSGQQLSPGKLELPASFRQQMPDFESFESASDPESVVSQMLRRVFRDEIARDEIRGSLSKIESDIGTKLRSEASILKQYVQKYRPEIEDVTVEPRFNFEGGFQGADLQLVEKGNRPITLDKRGTGMQHHVRLAVYEWNSGIVEKRAEEGAKAVIWAFDEPDLHLDYKCQRKLFDIIQDFVRAGVQVIICTHSINLINRVPIQQLVHYSLDDRRCTKVTTYKLTSENEYFFLHQIGTNMGLDNSLMFYERCFIIVEGEMEMHALPIIFERYAGNSMLTEGVRLINGENNGGARLFAKFLNEKHKNVILLVDEDCKIAAGVDKLFTVERLERDGFDVSSQVYFVGPKEFEYAFADSLWARVSKELGSMKDDGSSWAESHISALRQDTSKKFADHLRATFKVDTHQLAMTLGKVIKKGEIPDTIQRCFEGARCIANPEGYHGQQNEP